MQSKPLTLKVLDIVTVIVLAISTWLALVFAPTEIVMGQVQRVFYFHIGTAWVGLMGFVIAAVAGIVYLITHDLKWDRVELAAVEVSLVFFFITIVLGSIWARPAWNTWWTWDPRLTTYTIVLLLYIAYFMLRGAIEEPERRARFAAVYGIFAFLSVPLTFMSIRWWNTIHPVILDPNKGFGLGPGMASAFMIGILAFTILYVTLLANRLRVEWMVERVAALRERLLSA